MILSVQVEARLENTEGLLSVHRKSGMVGRDHDIVLSALNEMVEQWQVTDVESMFSLEARSTQYL